MAPEPSSSLFPPYPLSVTAYESLVSGSYIFRKDQPNENAEHFRVKEVRLYKCRSHPFHEYVIAHVSSPNIKSAYLRLERTRVKPKEEDTTEEDFLSRLPNAALADAFKEAISQAEESENFAPEDTPTPSPSPLPPTSAAIKSSQSLLSINSKSVSHSSDSIKESLNLIGTPAEDRVVAVNKDSFAKDEWLDTLSLPNFPLARLVCLAQLVHEEDPIYNLFSRQCYWYANLIMKVIEREPGVSSKGRRQGGENINLLRLVRFSRGTWWRIPVGTVEKKLVDTISQTFRTRWQQYMSKIQKVNASTASNNPGKALADERRQAVPSGKIRIGKAEFQAEGETDLTAAEGRQSNELKSREELEREIALLQNRVKALQQQTPSSHSRV